MILSVGLFTLTDKLFYTAWFSSSAWLHFTTLSFTSYQFHQPTSPAPQGRTGHTSVSPWLGRPITISLGTVYVTQTTSPVHMQRITNRPRKCCCGQDTGDCLLIKCCTTPFNSKRTPVMLPLHTVVCERLNNRNRVLSSWTATFTNAISIPCQAPTVLGL